MLQLQRINWENYGVYECYGKTFHNAIEELFYATSEVKIYCKFDIKHSEVPMIIFNRKFYCNSWLALPLVVSPTLFGIILPNA